MATSTDFPPPPSYRTDQFRLLAEDWAVQAMLDRERGREEIDEWGSEVSLIQGMSEGVGDGEGETRDESPFSPDQWLQKHFKRIGIWPVPTDPLPGKPGQS